MAVIEAEKVASVLWAALEELAQSQIFQNPLEPKEEETGLMIASLVLLATHIHSTVLRGTSGNQREAIYRAWTRGLEAANNARQVVDAPAKDP